ncbi:MAG: polyphosphate polymerase domain-containing protein [Tannerella sp.]|jgi:hypothetical protein|nr:polyphosphate polymerase domain-containing protein [Tannerella sp.]
MIFKTGILSAFHPVTLEEMGKIRLMNRVDTKYMTTHDGLCRFLSGMEEAYDIQETLHSRLCPYQTLYLDTLAADMYLAHHNRRGTRKKIRIRKYVDSRLYFLEVKDRSSKGRTCKTRIRIPEYVYAPDEAVRHFLCNHTSFTLGELSPHVEIDYHRITLVDRMKSERLTVDLNLAFRNRRTGQSEALPGLVIIERKQESGKPSRGGERLAQLGIRPVGLSKYCIGSVMTDPSLKHNLFKPKLRQINRLINL